MSDNGVTRRGFLQIVGLGGTSIAIAGCGNTSIESGVELVKSYVQPENFVVPGVGVYYASTCTQCASACGVMGRVREGRILKLEGNPQSAISGGKICGLGQAAVQLHYSPDRLKTPMIRDGGMLKPATWDQAMTLLGATLAPANKAGRRVWLTGPTSGHQQVLLRGLVDAGAATDHLVYDPLSSAVEASVNRRMFGVADPVTLIDRAGLVLSFGNDFLGAGESPVAAARQYARLRKAKRRGLLVQIEPKMTLTGANADRWVVIAPGTEGVFALGLARELVQRKDYAANLSPALLAALEPYTQTEVSRITGVPGDLIPRLVGMLWEHAPSLVLVGRYPQGHAHGSRNVAAIALLNVILQNQGRTVMRGADLPFPQLAPTPGDFRTLVELGKAMGDGQVSALLINGTNPVYSAPDFVQFSENLQKVAFKAAWVTELDETAMQCDLVLPLLSPLEDFGTHVASNQADGSEISIQQPLMEKLYPDTRAFGDVLLELLRKVRPDSYKAFPDYYAYLKSAVINAKPAYQPGVPDEEFWENTLSAGVLHRAAALQPLTLKDLDPEMIRQPAPTAPDAKYRFSLIPAVSPEPARRALREPAVAAGVAGSADHRRLGQLGGAASEHRQGDADQRRRRADHRIRAWVHPRQGLPDSRHPPGVGRGADRTGTPVLRALCDEHRRQSAEDPRPGLRSRDRRAGAVRDAGVDHEYRQERAPHQGRGCDEPAAEPQAGRDAGRRPGGPLQGNALCH